MFGTTFNTNIPTSGCRSTLGEATHTSSTRINFRPLVCLGIRRLDAVWILSLLFGCSGLYGQAPAQHEGQMAERTARRLTLSVSAAQFRAIGEDETPIVSLTCGQAILAPAHVQLADEDLVLLQRLASLLDRRYCFCSSSVHCVRPPSLNDCSLVFVARACRSYSRSMCSTSWSLQTCRLLFSRGRV